MSVIMLVIVRYNTTKASPQQFGGQVESRHNQRLSCKFYIENGNEAKPRHDTKVIN